MLTKLISRSLSYGLRYSTNSVALSDVLYKHASYPIWRYSCIIARVPAMLLTSRGYRYGIPRPSEDADDVKTHSRFDDAHEKRYNQGHLSWNNSYNTEANGIAKRSGWQETSDTVDEVAGDFKNFSISEATQLKLKANGINFLFPSQTSTFNPTYNGKDIIVQARTGSGKTLSYAIPLIERLQQSARTRSPRLLVMTPTRELARQVADVIRSLTDKLSVASVYGGASIINQERMLRSGVDVVVGTPGRIADFIERKTLDLSTLQHVVLDEVDRMLDMGFADSVDEILSHRYVRGNPEQNPQTLLYSATIPSWVQQTAQKYLRSDIVKLDLVGRGNVRTSTSVQHVAILCTPSNRSKVIADTLQTYSGSHGRAIIFCEMKREADRLASSKDIRVETEVLHGDIPQHKREMVLKNFREGRIQCLIATDVAARGLDIPEVDVVIQCSPPKDVDSYIHRSGRTGRAGKPGLSIVLHTKSEPLYHVEQVAGLKFEHLKPPTSQTTDASAIEDAVKLVERVSQPIKERFTPMAETVAANLGPVNALAAAIALLSGFGRPKSLLTAEMGFTTYMYRSSLVFDRVDSIIQSLQLPDSVKNKISETQLTADHKGCVFDLPSNCDEAVSKLWTDKANETLAPAVELPALSQVPAEETYFQRKPRFTDSRHRYGSQSRSHSYGSRDRKSNSHWSRKGLNDFDDD